MPSQRIEQELAERLWERGAPAAADRACFLAVAFVLRSGCWWRDLPDTFPSALTCWRRHRDWTNEGVWEKVWALVLAELEQAGQLDTTELCLAATFVGARKVASRSPTPCGAARA
jgi:transposase